LRLHNYLYYLLLIVLLGSCFIACKKTKREDPTPINPLSAAAQLSPYADLSAYFKKEANKQLFTLPANDASTRVKCSQGTIITFYRASIVDVNNTPINAVTDVRIEVQEYLSASDIVLYGKNTNSADSLLSSQGLINIKLKDGNGNALHIASVPNAVKIQFPEKAANLSSSDYYIGTQDASNYLYNTLANAGRNAFVKQLDVIDGGLFYTNTLSQVSDWIQCGFPKPSNISFAKQVTITFDDPRLIGKQKLVYAYCAALNAAYVSVTTNDAVLLNKLPLGYDFKLISLCITEGYMYSDVQTWNSTAAQELSPRSISDANYTLKIRGL
jgi:hypothetical protein